MNKTSGIIVKSGKSCSFYLPWAKPWQLRINESTCIPFSTGYRGLDRLIHEFRVQARREVTEVQGRHRSLVARVARHREAGTQHRLCQGVQRVLGRASQGLKRNKRG